MADYPTLKWRSSSRTIVSNQNIASGGNYTSSEMDYTGQNGCQLTKLHLVLSASTAPASGYVTVYILEASSSDGTYDNPTTQRPVLSYALRSTSAKVTGVVMTPGPYAKYHIVNGTDITVTVGSLIETMDSVTDTALS